MAFYIENVYCNMKKLFSKNVFKRPKRLKMDTLYRVREKNVYSVYFLVFIQNIENNRKLLKKSDFWCKIIFFFAKEMVFL